MKSCNRRVFMMVSAGGAAILHPVASQAAMKKVEENEPKAAAIGYRHDSSKVDSARYPKHKPTDRCNNCLAFAPDKPTDEWGECDLMSDRLVYREGWCSSYKPIKGKKA